jgi:integrase
MSSSAKGLKKSTVSSLCNYIENVLLDEMPIYKNFRNFTKGLPSIPKNQTYEKIKITKEEYQLMIDTLIEKKNYMGAAWVAVAFQVGARRGEIRQFKIELLDYPIPEGQNYILSHVVRGKGASLDGKPLKFMFNMEALKYIKIWIANRNYDNEYIFTVKDKGNIMRISETWADKFCARVLSKILGRRINPHLFKASCISTLLEDGVDLVLVSKYVAQHNDISTTSKFYDLREFEEEKNKIFK